MQIAYPIELSKKRSRTVRVALPDFADAFADCPRGEERNAAATLLVDALERCIKERGEIPKPSRAPVADLVEPPSLVAAKVCLYEAMREKELSNVAFAKQLGTVEGTVRRLIDVRHRSHIDQVEAALAMLGKRLILTVRSL